MKKFYLALGLLLSVAGTAQAQQTRIGLKAGLSLATITGNGSDELGNLVGLNGGIMVDVPTSEMFSFHPEFLYSQRGTSSTSIVPYGNGATRDVTSRFHYVDVPLLLRIKAKGLFFEVGPQVGILVTRKTEITYNEPNQGSYTQSGYGIGGARKIDVGYVLGLGYQLPQGLEFGVRYNGGLLDVSDSSRSSKSYHSVFQFQVGYLFGGK